MERLEQHAQTLAVAQTVTDSPRRDALSGPGSPRTAASCWPSYRILARAIKDERSITPAAEWLVDNFHIVDEQLREIRDDLPPDYYRELPKLAPATSPATLGSWVWPGPTSRTRTAASNRESRGAWSAPTRRWSR